MHVSNWPAYCRLNELQQDAEQQQQQQLQQQ